MGFDYSYKLIPFYICFLLLIQFHLDANSLSVPRQFVFNSSNLTTSVPNRLTSSLSGASFWARLVRKSASRRCFLTGIRCAAIRASRNRRRSRAEGGNFQITPRHELNFFPLQSSNIVSRLQYMKLGRWRI